MEPRHERGHLFIVSGPSGAGKGSVLKAASRKININLSISVTNRPKRETEENGKDYFFVESAQFDKLVNENKLLEWAELYGHKYGTPSDYVNEKIENGEDIYLEIDVQGARQVKKKVPDSVLIFIKAPTLLELEKRLAHRNTESKEAIEKRLEFAKSELEAAVAYDYIIENDNLDKAADEFVRIVKEVHSGRKAEIGRLDK